MRRKNPDAVKRLRGTDQPCRLSEECIEFDAVDVANPPDPPDWLNTWAAEYWERIVPPLIEQGVLSVADLEALEILCTLYGRVREYALAGTDVSAAVLSQLRLYQSEFGLTPASKQRVKVTGKEIKNRFSRNGKMRKQPRL